MKGWKRLLVSAMVAVLLVVGLAVPVSASISPDTVTAELNPCESITTTKTVEIPEMPPRADVVFSFDLTGSMSRIIATAKARAGDIIAALNALGVDIQYGVMSYMDYPHYYSSCGYPANYGQPGVDYAYRLGQAVTSNSAAVIAAINALTIGSGWDGPQDYTRVMYESYADLVGETNPTYGPVGWRPGAKKILVNFGDNVPHDCNLNDGVTSGTWSTGGDPGRDEVMGTADDLDLQTVLAAMADAGVILLECHTSIYAQEYWSYWTGITGGGVYITDSATLVDDITAAVTEGLTVPVVRDIHLEVATAGFEAWLESVVPASYAEVESGESVTFEETIHVPDGTAPGVYTFTISAVDDKGVSYGDQTVTITVPGDGPHPKVPGITGWGTIVTVVALSGLMLVVMRRRGLLTVK